VELDPVHDHPAGHGRAVRRPPLRRRQDEHVGRPAKGIARSRTAAPDELDDLFGISLFRWGQYTRKAMGELRSS